VEPGHGAIPQRASAESRDDRSDASTFALASAATEYAALRDERNEIGADGGSTPEIDTTPAAADVDFDAFLDRVTTHVLTTIGELRRETADVEGLVRFWGDDWRTAEQGAAKVWSIATLWGATAAAELGGLIRERDGDAADLFSAARDLYALCEPDGPFVNDAGTSGRSSRRSGEPRLGERTRPANQTGTGSAALSAGVPTPNFRPVVQWVPRPPPRLVVRDREPPCREGHRRVDPRACDHAIGVAPSRSPSSNACSAMSPASLTNGPSGSHSA